jgi:glutamate-1-semialdehyde 2,1-aminomutase
MYHNSGSELWKKTKRLIPGGSQLLSKRSEQFLPDLWPSYYRSAQGVEVLDLDNNRYIDMSLMGVGSCPLGYADPDVNAAVKQVIDAGSMCTLNAPEEVELAELMIHLHPWADMVRYARCGGEAMAVAVRIARAHTRRDVVAFCGYHGWHDWYLSANLSDDRSLDGHLLPGLDPAGVPRGLTGTALPFRFNHPEDLETICNNHRDTLAAIVMEPIRDHPPEPAFLKTIRECAEATGAVLVIDEVSSGFRMRTGGAHLNLGIKPDIAVFAKALGNGYPMAAIIGNRSVMESAQDTFISSTYWTERIGPAAALATIRKYEEHQVANHLMKTGKAVQEIWERAAGTAGLRIEVGGIYPLSHFSFLTDQSLVAQTLFTQIMLGKGFLAGKSFYASFAHTPAHLASYETAVTDAFGQIARAVDAGTLEGLLQGPPAQSGFKRLT